MVKWETYRSGALWGTRYVFEHAGEKIPKHKHAAPEDMHNIIVLRGEVAITAWGADTTRALITPRAAPYDFNGELPHEIEATQDGTIILNLQLWGLPAGATGEHVSGHF